MKEFERHEASEVSIADMARQAFAVLAALVGLGTKLAGIYFAFKLFGAAYSALTAPELFGPIVDQWAQNLGGDQPMFEAEGVRLSPRLVAVFVLGGCGLILLWITVAVISVGAKVVYWMGTDLDAVRRVLSQVFGPATIQVVKGPQEKPPKPLSVPPRQ
jgi:hypothetical protein